MTGLKGAIGKAQATATGKHPESKKLRKQIKRDGLAKVNIEMPKSKRRALKIAAATKDRTISGIINELTSTFLTENGYEYEEYEEDEN